MDDRSADFIMTSTESLVYEMPRKCYRVKRLAGPRRDDYLLIEVDPPVPAYHRLAGKSERSQLVVATRFAGFSLFAATEWPVPVYVAEPLIDDPEKRDYLRDNDLLLVDWAELYPPDML